MSTQIEHTLPKPGTVYRIPEGTHADLDLQDDKEVIFYRHSGARRFRYMKPRR